MPESRAYYHDLREACAAGGCPLCTVADRSAESFINALLWETVTDVDARRRVVAAYGFCREHGWRLDRPGGASGAAIMLHDVIKALIAALDDSATLPGPAGGSMWDRLRGRRASQAGDVLQPAAACPVCAHVQRIEADAAQALLVYLTPGAHTLVAPFTASSGLCLEHLRLTLAQPGKAAAHATLVAAQRTIWQRLQGELAEFIRKQDVQFRGESYGSERDAWERALKITSGPPPRKTSTGLTQARVSHPHSIPDARR